jgi:hypothetical protein
MTTERETKGPKAQPYSLEKEIIDDARDFFSDAAPGTPKHEAFFDYDDWRGELFSIEMTQREILESKNRFRRKREGDKTRQDRIDKLHAKQLRAALTERDVEKKIREVPGYKEAFGEINRFFKKISDPYELGLSQRFEYDLIIAVRGNLEARKQRTEEERVNVTAVDYLRQHGPIRTLGHYTIAIIDLFSGQNPRQP